MTDVSQVLRQVLERTFEDFAFMFIEPVPVAQVLEADAQTYVRAEIRYAAEGERGELTAVASMDFCNSLSRNVLGLDMDQDVDPGTAESALSELVNVACGSLAEALYGAEEAVDLEPAGYELGTSQEWRELMDAHPTLVLLVDDYPVGFRLRQIQGAAGDAGQKGTGEGGCEA